MTEAVFAADGNLILHLINPRAKEMFNLSGKDTQNLSLLEATRSTELEETARAALMENRPLEKELKLHNGAGEQRFQVFAAPLAGEENRDGEGVVLVLQDITQLIRLEQVRKDFVANVSHELRTPIQLMKGFSETLLDLPPDDTKQIRYCVEIIRKNAATMENLVTDLLTLASLENENGVRPAAEEQELAPLFAEAVSSLELQAKKKQIEIIVTCPEGIKAKIYGPYIIQALINLLDNAVKYSPEKSRVWIAARRGNNGAGLVLEVRDEGIGIPAEHLGRIFERFYRVDRAHSRETGGTGLGLSIVRHIALIHNGTAEAESSTGEGSVFRIRLPG
jgi:two-component system phosphate regulon sensor histidine kinase PhoR